MSSGLQADRGAEPADRLTPRFGGRRAALLLVLLSLAAILPGLFMGIHADDWFHIRYRALPEVIAAFTGDWNVGARGQGGFYRPLVRLLFYFDSILYGLHSAGYHLTNGLLFAAMPGALYRICLVFAPGRHRGVLLVLGALFVLNPLKNEALYWISGRTDLLAGALVLWAVYFALRAIDENSFARGVAALGFLAAGLLAKEIAMAGCLILPLAALLLGPGGRWSRARVLVAAGPIAIGAVYFVFRAAVLGGLAGYEGSRSVGMLFANLGRMLSALFWPWQANETGGYNLQLAIPGVAAVLLVLVTSGFRRGLVWALLSLLAALAPMVFVPITPLDGNRVLMLGLGFQMILLAQIFLGPGSRNSACRAAAFAAIIAALSLQPSNIAIIREFLDAREPNERLIEFAWKDVESLPGGATLVLPETRPGAGRRILDPGNALIMAMQTYWMRQSGAITEDSSDLDEGRISMEWSVPGRIITAAVILQPWMEGRILWLAPGGNGSVLPISLERIGDDNPDPATLAIEDGVCILPFDCGPCEAVSVMSRMEEAVNRPPDVTGQHGGAGSGRIFSLSVSQGGVTCRWFAAMDHEGQGWSNLQWTAPGENGTLRLKALRVARYSVSGNCGGR